MEEIGYEEIMIFTIAFILYFLPSYIGRRHENFMAIFLLNLLMGWTVVCWIGSLIWALTDDERTRESK